MPKKKKPLLIIKFSNDSKCKNEAKSHKKKTNKSASNGSPTSARGNSAPRKLRS